MHHFSAQKADPRATRTAMIWIYRAVRLVLGVVFIYSGSTKLYDPKGFSVIIDAYGLTPEVFTLPAALSLSLLEVLAGLGLILEIQWSLGIITGLLVMFMAILSYGLWMGLDVDCGCFGPDDPEAHAFHSLRPALYRDMVMMAAVAYLFLWRRLKSLRPVKFSTLYQTLVQRKRR